MWLLHGLGTPAQISDDLVEAQRKAKQQGKVRFIGMSTHTLPAIVDRVIEAKLEVVQAQYNFTSAAEWGPALDKLHQAGVGLVAMKVMARAGRRPQGRRRAAAAAGTARQFRARRAQVGHQEPRHRHYRPQHDRHRPTGAELRRHGAAVHRRRPEDPHRPLGRDHSLLLPHVRHSAPGSAPRVCRWRDMVRFVMYADGYGQFPLGREHFQRMSAEHRPCVATIAPLASSSARTE